MAKRLNVMIGWMDQVHGIVEMTASDLVSEGPDPGIRTVVVDICGDMMTPGNQCGVGDLWPARL